MKNKFVKNIPRNILIMIILIFITFRYLLRGFSRKEVIHAFFNADKRILGFGIVLSLLYMLCEGYNTKSMLELFGYKTNIFKTVNYAFTGYFFSGLTPSATGGQPMQMVVMKTDGITLFNYTYDRVVCISTNKYKYGINWIFFKLRLYIFKKRC